MNYINIKAGDLVRELMKRGVSIPKQAKLWGVTTLQLRNYKKGKVIVPRIDVAYKALQNITLDGKAVVIEPYTTPYAIEEAYKLHETTSTPVK